MLKHIALRNFRSVIDARVSLAESSITVLVGANGSGKSNVVKALDFIGGMSTCGLSDAVRAQGGRNGLLPKAIPEHSLSHATTSVEYTSELPPPPSYPDAATWPTVTHGITLAWTAQAHLIERERITFTQVLSVARALYANSKRQSRASERVRRADSAAAARPLSVTFEKDAAGGLSTNFDRHVDDAEIEDIVFWLGPQLIPAGLDRFKTQKDLSEFMGLFYASLRERQTGDTANGKRDVSLLSFVDSAIVYPFELSAQMGTFIAGNKEIRRYDLHLSALRKEQPISNQETLAVDGSNLPSAYRNLRENPGEAESLDRISDTLRALAPYISAASVHILANRNEYLEFLETAVGRPVESWESSDGTLRALAILVALETHPPGGTIMIEEPERGLHPWGIKCLIEHMRDVVQRRRLQIVLTTHSAQVLEHVEPSEVRVLQRSLDKGTEILTLAEALPYHSIEMGEVGQLWLTGLLGGLPAYEH